MGDVGASIMFWCHAQKMKITRAPLSINPWPYKGYGASQSYFGSLDLGG